MKTITKRDLERIQTTATSKAETIPKSHCRIKEETYHRAIIDGCNGAKERKPGRAAYMVVNVGYNQGNSRYPHWIRTAEIVPIHKGAAETAKTYNGYRKTSILALVK